MAMAKQAEPRTESRVPLSKERVLLGAVRLADQRGIGALTMRNLAQELGVEAMSLYYHVANKEELMAGTVDVVVDEINLVVSQVDTSSVGTEWKRVVRQRILAARDVLLGHPWAPDVIESHASMSPSVLRYFNALSGLLRQGGLSVDLVHHALHALGSRALGFTHELFAPEPDAEEETDPGVMMEQMADEYPYLTEIVAHASHNGENTLGWCDDQEEFEFGLDLILDGLERRNATV
jgi:AcrR family transcriptional regulator